MKIEYFRASKFGKGAHVAEEFRQQMAAKGVTAEVHHIREARPNQLPPADLYAFSSPGRTSGVWPRSKSTRPVAACHTVPIWRR